MLLSDEDHTKEGIGLCCSCITFCRRHSFFERVFPCRRTGQSVPGKCCFFIVKFSPQLHVSESSDMFFCIVLKQRKTSCFLVSASHSFAGSCDDETCIQNDCFLCFSDELCDVSYLALSQSAQRPFSFDLADSVSFSLAWNVAAFSIHRITYFISLFFTDNIVSFSNVCSLAVPPVIVHGWTGFCRSSSCMLFPRLDDNCCCLRNPLHAAILLLLSAYAVSDLSLFLNNREEIKNHYC